MPINALAPDRHLVLEKKNDPTILPDRLRCISGYESQMDSEVHRVVRIVRKELMVSLRTVGSLGRRGAASAHCKEQASGQDDSNSEFEHGVSPKTPNRGPVNFIPKTGKAGSIIHAISRFANMPIFLFKSCPLPMVCDGCSG